MTYACQRCGNCCRWPGFVALRDDEPDKIAAFLNISVEQFIAQYTELRPNRDGLGIISKPNHECIFLEGKNTCLIQPVKPAQCGGFPNTWNFEGWRDVCEATPVDGSSEM